MLVNMLLLMMIKYGSSIVKNMQKQFIAVRVNQRMLELMRKSNYKNSKTKNKEIAICNLFNRHDGTRTRIPLVPNEMLNH